jgi:hypothetical protein
LNTNYYELIVYYEANDGVDDHVEVAFEQLDSSNEVYSYKLSKVIKITTEPFYSPESTNYEYSYDFVDKNIEGVYNMYCFN